MTKPPIKGGFLSTEDVELPAGESRRDIVKVKTKSFDLAFHSINNCS